ncbi:MAG: hypothetical protein WCK15_23155 [Pirellula sp.]
MPAYLDTALEIESLIESWRRKLLELDAASAYAKRMNDQAHYPSQVGLGWLIAYVSASAIAKTDTGKEGWSFKSFSTGTDNGIAAQFRW